MHPSIRTKRQPKLIACLVTRSRSGLGSKPLMREAMLAADSQVAKTDGGAAASAGKAREAEA
jgi:hypothetical protein